MMSRDSRLALLSPLLAVLVAVGATPGAASAGSSYSYTNNSEDRFGFALFPEGSDGIVMTNSDNWQEFKRARKDDEAMLWFKLDGKRGVIRNVKVIEKADEACAEMIALGDEQGRIGERQGKIGNVQGHLGDRQGEIGEAQAAASQELSDLHRRIARTASRGESTRDLERRARELEDEIEDMGVEQSALGRQQSLLGAQQSALGKKQSELGARQAKASERARVEVKDLVAAAIKDGQVEWVQ
jgi:hypothetical protein